MINFNIIIDHSSRLRYCVTCAALKSEDCVTKSINCNSYQAFSLSIVSLSQSFSFRYEHCCTALGRTTVSHNYTYPSCCNAKWGPRKGCFLGNLWHWSSYSRWGVSIFEMCHLGTWIRWSCERNWECCKGNFCRRPVVFSIFVEYLMPNI